MVSEPRRSLRASKPPEKYVAIIYESPEKFTFTVARKRKKKKRKRKRLESESSSEEEPTPKQDQKPQVHRAAIHQGAQPQIAQPQGGQPPQGPGSTGPVRSLSRHWPERQSTTRGEGAPSWLLEKEKEAARAEREQPKFEEFERQFPEYRPEGYQPSWDIIPDTDEEAQARGEPEKGSADTEAEEAEDDEPWAHPGTSQDVQRRVPMVVLTRDPEIDAKAKSKDKGVFDKGKQKARKMFKRKGSEDTERMTTRSQEKKQKQ